VVVEETEVEYVAEPPLWSKVPRVGAEYHLNTGEDAPLAELMRQLGSPGPHWEESVVTGAGTTGFTVTSTLSASVQEFAPVSVAVYLVVTAGITFSGEPVPITAAPSDQEIEFIGTLNAALNVNFGRAATVEPLEVTPQTVAADDPVAAR
jgi:hypothetical protein